MSPPHQPKSEAHQAINVAEDLRRQSAQHGDCCRQGSIPWHRATHSTGVSVAWSPWEDVQNGCAARCGGGGLHKSTKPDTKSELQHDATMQSPAPQIQFGYLPEACGAEPSAAAAATGSASVESTTSLASASAGTCGGVPPKFASNAQKAALDRQASLASARTARRGHERRAAPRS